MTATHPKITPTQRRILAVLSDGEPHSREELIECFWDADVDDENKSSLYNTLRVHISNIRKLLVERGQDVVCVKTSWAISRWRPMYRQIRHLRRRLTK